MQYGCCVNLLPRPEGRVGAEYAPGLKRLGYDYIELPLNAMTHLTAAQRREVCRVLEDTDLPCRSCNDFMSPQLRITGPEPTPWQELMDYLGRAMEVLDQMGASIAVFGSPWSRSCPEGFSREKAWDQIARFLDAAAGLAAAQGAVIAVEHNNRTETNMINRFAQAVEMVRQVGHPNLKALCDYYHLRFEGDDPQVLEAGRGLLVHTHMAQLEGRRYPTSLEREPMLLPYGRQLHAMGYEGGVSVEARVDSREDWEREAQAALETLKAALG